MIGFEPKIIAFLCKWGYYECGESGGKGQKE